MRRQIIIIFLMLSNLSYSQTITNTAEVCNVRIEAVIVDSLPEKYVICFELNNCKDKRPVKHGTADLQYKTGKRASKKLDKDSRLYFTYSQFLDLAKIEIKSKDYLNVSWDTDALKHYKEQILTGKFFKLIYYTDLIAKHTIKCN